MLIYTENICFNEAIAIQSRVPLNQIELLFIGSITFYYPHSIVRVATLHSYFCTRTMFIKVHRSRRRNAQKQPIKQNCTLPIIAFSPLRKQRDQSEVTQKSRSSFYIARFAPKRDKLSFESSPFIAVLKCDSACKNTAGNRARSETV